MPGKCLLFFKRSCPNYFDDLHNGDLLDASGNGNNGIANGTGFSDNTPGLAPATQPSNTHSLSFDGVDDYISAPNSATLNPGIDDFSITGWIKTPSTGGIVCSKSAGSGQADPNNDDWYIVSVDGGRIAFEITDGYTGPGDYVYLVGTTNINDNSWHHFSLVFDRSGLGYIYVDGELDNSADISAMQGEIISNDPLEIGYDTNHITQYFTGKLDALAIWSTALTADDILSLLTTNPIGSNSNLNAYWNFNEGSGSIAFDGTAHGNNAGIIGATWDPDVPLVDPQDIDTNTHSLSFDGVNDYIPYIDGVEPNGSLSLCAWFKTTMTGTARLISKTSSENIFFMMIQNDGILRLNVMDGACVTTSSFNDDSWHFAVGVWDGSTVKMYVDGQLEAEQLGTVNPDYTNVNTAKPFIGSQDPTWENFQGLLDEISVWDVALSTSQIQTFYTHPISGSESGLVGHWNFNEGSGTTVNDVTGNGYNGSIVGATYSTDVPFTGSATTSNLTWNLRIQGSQASLNDVDNYLGVAADASNAFDAAHDEAEPPPAPGSSLSLYFPHPEWGHALGDDFSSDIRPEIDLSDTMQVWDLEVVSTDAGNVSLTFQFTYVPDLPVILENKDTGERVSLVHNDSYSFGAVANETYFFKISIGDTTAPQVTAGSSFSGPRILRAGHPHDLDFSAIDGFMIDQMDLLFSSDSGNSFHPFATFGDTTEHAWFAPDSFDNVLYSAALQIKATDYAGNSATSESDYVLTIASDSLFSSVANGWNLWGAPLTPAVDTMEVNIDDDFEGYWTTYDYVDHGYTYDGFLTSGAGYWLGTLEQTEIDVIGTPSVGNEVTGLDLGWNLLSNPLVVDVYVDSLMVTNGNTSETLFYADAVNAGWVNSIYSYDGNGYVEPSEILPWHGYWFSALTDNISITFPIHKHGQMQLARDIREDGWGLQLFASTSNGAEDNLLILGSHPEATNEFDNGFDEVRPPSAPGSRFVQLDVLHPEWALPLGDSFVRDIRAANVVGENEDWIVSTSSSEDDFSITWDISLVPEEYDVGIDLTGDGIFQDLTSFEAISIVAGTEFTIRVGANALATDNLGLPTAFQMSQNYPNPFNPTTTIKYGLPTLSDVSIIIYDITGREVIRLVNAAQKPAGYYEVAWNGIDANHHPASTGLYFTRIVAGDFTKTVKMLYLK